MKRQRSMKKNIGKLIRKYRKKRNLSQKDLAKLVEVDVCTISLYEREKFNPSITTIVKIAKALGISTDYLLMEEISKEAKDRLKDKELLYLFSKVKNFTKQDQDMIKQLLQSLAGKYEAIKTEKK